MIVKLSFSMQCEVTIECTIVMCVHFSMQEENIHEHTNAKCYLCT